MQLLINVSTLYFNVDPQLFALVLVHGCNGHWTGLVHLHSIPQYPGGYSRLHPLLNQVGIVNSTQSLSTSDHGSIGCSGGGLVTAEVAWLNVLYGNVVPTPLHCLGDYGIHDFVHQLDFIIL